MSNQQLHSQNYKIEHCSDFLLSLRLEKDVTRVLESREASEKRGRTLSKPAGSEKGAKLQRILSRTSSFDSTYTAESPFQSNPLLVLKF